MFYYLNIDYKKIRQSNNNDLIMPLLINRSVFIKMRRIFQLLTLTFVVIIVITIGSKWSSSTTINDNYQQLTVKINPISIIQFYHQIEI